MKKTYLSFVIILALATSLVFVGCNKQEDYFKQTAQMATEFVETEKYDFLFKEDAPLSYTNAIDNAINSSDEIYLEYKMLSTFYETSLTNLTLMFSKLYPNLTLAPQQNNKNIKKAYSTFEREIETFKTAADNFLDKKEFFVSSIGASLTASNSKTRLNDFKTHYKTFLFAAKNFYTAFKSLYTLSFLPYPNLETNSVKLGTQKLIFTTAVGKLTSINLEYMFDDASNTEHLDSLPTLLQEAATIKQAGLNTLKNETELTLKELKDFLQVENIYSTEAIQFQQALDNFSFTEYFAAEDKTAFLEQNNNNLYFTKIERFLQNYTPYYAQALIGNLL